MTTRSATGIPVSGVNNLLNEEESKLDEEIHEIQDQLGTLEGQMRILKNTLKSMNRHKQTIVTKRNKERARVKNILTKASDRLNYGNKIYNKKCSQDDYSNKKMLDGYICSKSLDGYRYRSPGNPGDINYSDRDVVHEATNKSFKKDIGYGKIGNKERYTKFEINEMRAKLIEDHEADVTFNREYTSLRPGGEVERFASKVSRAKIFREATNAYDGTDVLAPRKGSFKKGKTKTYKKLKKPKKH